MIEGACRWWHTWRRFQRDLEAGVKEAAQRLYDDPLEREINRLSVGDDAVHIAAVKDRLKSILAP